MFEKRKARKREAEDDARWEEITRRMRGDRPMVELEEFQAELDWRHTSASLKGIEL